MTTKLERLKAHMAAGHTGLALRECVSWPRLGDEREAIERGWEAYLHPDFYRQIGENPDELVAIGLDAIRQRYHIK
jgi:hypothetical protein